MAQAQGAAEGTTQRYRVSLADTHYVDVEVEALSFDDAENKAREAYNFGDIESHEYDGKIEIEHVELVRFQTKRFVVEVLVPESFSSDDFAHDYLNEEGERAFTDLSEA